ncbi:MAG TPA: hypothetical protein VF744_02305 [Beijerinckiaceae bacterium]|jgi:hypothetical protein
MKIKGECEEETSVERIKVEELGRKATFVNEEHNTYRKTQMDGCVVKNQLAADWVVSRANIGDVIIELKGRHVEHAVRQIRATAGFLTDGDYREGRLAGLVVCTQFPKASTTVQRAQAEFARAFKGPLHVVTQNLEYAFENVLSFKGPHRSD